MRVDNSFGAASPARLPTISYIIFGTHGNYSMVIGKVGTNWYNLNKNLVGLKMAIFQNQINKRVIIHYSSFDPLCPML
jgi:hypothetical protein